MYEQKHHLLFENQLVYAVLQLEKESGELKLQCRWLDDLTKVDGSMVAECDTAYDKAKTQAKLSELREKNAKQKPESKASEKIKEDKKPMPTLLHIKLDIDQVRLSQILLLKECFRASPGGIPIRIEFLSNEQSVGNVRIDSSWGINATSKLQEDLKKIISIKSLELISK
jgi:DNA polymerase-3 subunit alpha